MDKILDIHVAELPVPWSRTRGREVRFKSEELRTWQTFLAEIAHEEIAMMSHRVTFPCDGPLRVSMLFLYPDEKALARAGDLDNLAKAILDALNGLAWKDDKLKYIRKLEVSGDVAQSSAMVGTHVEVYRL